MEQGEYVVKVKGPTVLDENVLCELIKDGFIRSFKSYSVVECTRTEDIVIKPRKGKEQ